MYFYQETTPDCFTTKSDDWIRIQSSQGIRIQSSQEIRSRIKNLDPYPNPDGQK